MSQSDSSHSTPPPSESDSAVADRAPALRFPPMPDPNESGLQLHFPGQNASADHFDEPHKKKTKMKHRPTGTKWIWTGLAINTGEGSKKERGSDPELPLPPADCPCSTQSDQVLNSTEGLCDDDATIPLELPAASCSVMSLQATDSSQVTPPDDIPSPPSKFSDKLNSNYIPSHPEISEIKKYVSTVNGRLLEYDKEIASLEAALEELNSKRSRLQDVRDAHHALTSPLRRLPPELLQIIFVWCLPQQRNAVMHASEAPVLLGRVCSEWRRISLNTPEVWSSLHIVPPNVNYSNPASSMVRYQRKRELLEMWFSRSGACPLAISMVWFSGDSEEEVKLCGSLLEVLVPFSRKWKVLDFQVPLKMFKPFQGLTMKDVPLLEGMSLMDNRTPFDVDITDRWPESLSFAENCTSLRHFTLTFFSGGIRLPSIPWSQLSTVYLESNIAFFFTDSRDMLSTLANCSNLRSCTLKFPLSHTATLPAFEKLDDPITLPQLQILCVDGDQHLQNTFHMSNTLVNICAPKLRILEILGRTGRPEGCTAPDPLIAIRTMLQRSKCPLEKLNMESLTLLPDELIPCLILMPDLQELVVHNYAVRMFVTPPEEETVAENDEIAENRILKALTISSKNGVVVNVSGGETARIVGKSEVTLEDGQIGDNAEAGTYLLPAVDLQLAPLCPKLQRLDFTLCDASQTIMCNFIASRWNDVPEGVSRFKSIKCNFTSFEDESAKARMNKFRAEGLDVSISYQVPISDDVNPSPWTGLDGPNA
ncbi:hypothetical protein CPB84DRAFT_1769370 [Gymnopilus junonius]|uniref:F-box domain-containing protein n=1 Tax=Gymnopilus junonius TaxID=109634 RepID=A0A9P5TS69_GYMJU|nr:hypothetical protein CPB84DRAFT_1769370 [Gymnopilus junonius]